MRELPGPAVFTHSDAVDAGWTPAALKHAVATGRLTRLSRGVYTSASDPGPMHAALGAALATPRSAVSHRSAALLHGLPIVGQLPQLTEVTVRPGSNANVAGVHLHRAGLRDQDVIRIGDTAVTSVERTLVDLARARPLSTAVSAIDAALHRGLTAPHQLDGTLLDCWNWPGIRRAQRAVDLADGRAESPLESISRLTIRWLRLPPPVPQAVVLDATGAFLGRCDFYWDEFGVVGEADGRAEVRRANRPHGREGTAGAAGGRRARRRAVGVAARHTNPARTPIQARADVRARATPGSIRFSSVVAVGGGDQQPQMRKT